MCFARKCHTQPLHPCSEQGGIFSDHFKVTVQHGRTVSQEQKYYIHLFINLTKVYFQREWLCVEPYLNVYTDTFKNHSHKRFLSITIYRILTILCPTKHA